MKIINATDGSEFSHAAVERVCEDFIRDDETEIKIISVYQTAEPFDSFADSLRHAEESGRAKRGLAQQNADQVAGTIRNCSAGAEVELSTEVAAGASDRKILETAKNWKANLIVTGSHERGFWGGALIGSVLGVVVQHVPCSVLIVRQKTSEEKDKKEDSSTIDLSKIDLTNIT